MSEIYRGYTKSNGTMSYVRIIDIDVATGNVKGVDLYTGRKITIKYTKMLDKVYFTQRELERRFPNYKYEM
jgi:hypothetical protein